MPATEAGWMRSVVHRSILRRRAHRALAWWLLLALPASAQGQQADGNAPGLAPGARVRVTITTAPAGYLEGQAALSRDARTRRWDGRLVRIGADSLTMRVNGDTLAFARAALQSLDVHMERTRFQTIVRHGAIGAGAGAVVGTVVGLVGYEPCEPGEWFCMSRGEETAYVAVVFGVSGAAAGALVGAFRETGIWRRTTLAPGTRVALGVTPGSAQVSIAF